MDVRIDAILAELRTLIEDLGKDGGLISPSVYDTAQVLRLYPPKEGVEAGLEWLLSQQHDDGGWGAPSWLMARDVPTLAALLALQTYRRDQTAQKAIEAGLAFLRRQAAQWDVVHIDAFPVAVEVILPYLLQEANKLGLHIDCAPYRRLFALRERKLQLLKQFPIAANSAPTYSWEALDLPFAPEMMDPLYGVGHSPAATAAWLHAAKDHAGIEHLREQGEAYLARAQAATRTGVPGVVPSAYPSSCFELAYSLYALMLAGHLHHPALQDVVQPQLLFLQDVVEDRCGLGLGEAFVPDADDTSVAVAVLRDAGCPVDVGLVQQFWRNDHFYTYVQELNPSVLSNAHALHALCKFGIRCPLTEAFLIERQTDEGWWIPDKWHSSWRFITMETIVALAPLGYQDVLVRAGHALLADQQPDGSWRTADGAGTLETVYTVLALQTLDKHRL
ncbi:MAG TPA: prenyltransferase/squalene oxidase repeat-containing protein, partial [Caldilineaceae bacterium]|nr:prenyltransferase/squalene oxidase repeat-containing protein [Caldilineaceae bacterium]